MKRKKLATRVIISFIIISAVIILTTSAAIAFKYRKSAEERYSNLAYGYAKSAAGVIDGEAVENYYKNGKMDEEYNKILNMLNAFQTNTTVKYYYVFVPLENDIVYIWDATTYGNACRLGQHEEYMVGGKEASMAMFKKNPKENMYITNDDTYGYIASAYYPIYDNAGEPVALVGVDVDVAGVTNDIVSYCLAVIPAVELVIVIAMILLYLFIRGKVIVPVKKLNKATLDVVDKISLDEQFAVDIHSGDEIEELAKSFENMTVDIKDYIKRLNAITAEKERIGAELNVATKIQADMLPKIFPPFPNKKEFDIYATMTPAKEVGGDFYDFFFVDDNHFAMVMADVSGKGVPAALFMVISKTLLKNRSKIGGSPSNILEIVNNQLCENNEEEMFVTCWLGIVDVSTGKLQAASAGHEYPAIKKANKKFELFKDKHGFVLAGFENSKYYDYEIQLEKGDYVYVYTDGVAEAINADNELFGTERMIDALNAKTNITCKEALEQVKESIDDFVKDAPQFDDITMLCFKYEGV